MRNASRNGMAVVAAVCVLILVGPACQPGPIAQEAEEPEEAEMEADQVEVTIEPSKDPEEGWSRLDPVTVRRGMSVTFRSPSAKAWILIPSGALQHHGGRGLFSGSDGFVAFEVLVDGTTMRLPDDYSGAEQTVHYSVMVEQDGRWSYVHGSNPPPRMIIGG